MAFETTNFNLQSSTHNDPFASLVFTADADRTAGDIIKVGDLVGVVIHDTDTGDDGVLVYRATKLLVPCAIATSGSYTVGSKVYADLTNNEVTETASGNYLCGTVVEAPSVGDETVLIDWDGRLCIVA